MNTELILGGINVFFSYRRSWRSAMFGAVVVGAGMVGSVRIRDMLAPLAGSTVDKLSVKGFISR